MNRHGLSNQANGVEQKRAPARTQGCAERKKNSKEKTLDTASVVRDDPLPTERKAIGRATRRAAGLKILNAGSVCGAD